MRHDGARSLARSKESQVPINTRPSSSRKRKDRRSLNPCSEILALSSLQSLSSSSWSLFAAAAVAIAVAFELVAAST